MNKLTSRLQDQQARTHISELLDLSYEVIGCDDFKIAQAKLLEMQYRLRDTNDEILGPILRNTFDL